jgi:hypothetical protein
VSSLPLVAGAAEAELPLKLNAGADGAAFLLLSPLVEVVLLAPNPPNAGTAAVLLLSPTVVGAAVVLLPLKLNAVAAFLLLSLSAGAGAGVVVVPLSKLLNALLSSPPLVD